MLRLDYKDYFDKVYGCYLGKAMMGNIGAPYEGMKQLLDFSYDEDFFKEMIPNDDLDLQVLWLEVLEKKGKYFTSKDLADAFAEKCPYAPGEYAVFKRNYAKGIYPPYSGSFNARMFENGMGSPIRSEIWACVSAGNARLAAKYARMDSCIDHKRGSDSENGEVFFAALEALAFGCGTDTEAADREELLFRLTEEALAYVPEDCLLAEVVRNTAEWYKSTRDFVFTRGQIIRLYGDAEATVCYQNIGFIILSLLKGNMDFLDSSIAALNCGFDTDCTCATVGAFLGILYGAEYIRKKYRLPEATYRLGVDTKRRSDLVRDLSEDIAAVGYYFSLEENENLRIDGYVGEPMKIARPKEEIGFSVEYVGEPSLSFGETKEVRLIFTNLTDSAKEIEARLKALSGLALSIDGFSGRIESGQNLSLNLLVKAPESAALLWSANKISITVNAGPREYKFDFGFSGDKEWAVYGPFWKNIAEVPKLKAGEGYWPYIVAPSFPELTPIDVVRHYHMNSLPDYTEYDFGQMFAEESEKEGDRDARFTPRYIHTEASDFVLEDYERFNGQANYYLRTKIYSPEAREAGLQIGFTDTCRVWLNRRLVAEHTGSNKFTQENRHVEKILLKEGENELVVMLSKIGEVTRFGYDFVTGSACTDNVVEIASVNLRAGGKD